MDQRENEVKLGHGQPLLEFPGTIYGHLNPRIKKTSLDYHFLEWVVPQKLGGLNLYPKVWGKAHEFTLLSSGMVCWFEGHIQSWQLRYWFPPLSFVITCLQVVLYHPCSMLFCTTPSSSNSAICKTPNSLLGSQSGSLAAQRKKQVMERLIHFI